MRELTPELTPEPWDGVPQMTETDTTYYERPMLKQSVWSIDIPLYYFLGGAAGAALCLGAAIQLVASRNDRELRRLSSVCHWTGIIGSTAGAGFLIHDLGRPSRFLYMLRVFRPTSPMNMGAWILSGAAPTAIATGLFLNRRGLPGKLGKSAATFPECSAPHWRLTPECWWRIRRFPCGRNRGAGCRFCLQRRGRPPPGQSSRWWIPERREVRSVEYSGLRGASRRLRPRYR